MMKHGVILDFKIKGVFVSFSIAAMVTMVKWLQFIH